MDYYAIYSGRTGALIYGLGYFDSLEDAEDYAVWKCGFNPWNDNNDYVGEANWFAY